MMIDEHLDEGIRLWASRLHRHQRRRARAVGTLVELLARIELRVDEEAMLQIIDPQLDRFGIRHRTQMAGDLQMSPMRLLDRGLKVGAGDVHVCLEAIHALVGPEGNLLSRVLGRSDLVGLDEEGSWSLQIRAG